MRHTIRVIEDGHILCDDWAKEAPCGGFYRAQKHGTISFEWCMNGVKELTEKIKRFRDERNWRQFHDHKSMAVSLVLEAAELLEHFQWTSKEEGEKYGQDNKEAIAEEMADVAIYLFELADNLGIDVIDAIEKKLKKNAEKYPVEKAKGRHTKYNKL